MTLSKKTIRELPAGGIPNWAETSSLSQSLTDILKGFIPEKLSTKLSVLTGALILFLMIGDGLFIERKTNRIIRGREIDSINIIVDNVKEILDLYINSHLTTLKALSTQRLIQNSFNEEQERVLAQERLVNLLKWDSDIWAVFVVGMDGKVVSGLNADGIDMSGLDRSWRDYVQALLRGENQFIWKVQMAKSKDIPVLPLSIIIQNKKGEKQWAVVIMIDWTKFIEKHVASIKIWNSWYIYMLDDKWNIVSHPDKKLLLTQMNSEWVATILNNTDGDTSYQFEWKKKTLAFDTDKLTGLKIIGNVLDSELEGDAKEIRNWLLSWSAAVCFILILTIYVMFQRKVGKPMKSINDYLREIESWNLDVVLWWKFGKDELWELRASLLQMVKALKDRLWFSNWILGWISTPLIVADPSQKISYINQWMLDLLGL